METDKACYQPGDTVKIRLTLESPAGDGKIVVSYRHLNRIIGKDTIDTGSAARLTWNWFPPGTDFCGYLVEASLQRKQEIADQRTIAVDVSSDWKKFPRCGFLSRFSRLSPEHVDSVISNLSRFHINGLQFYDWHYKHHHPVKLIDGKPAAVWQDIGKRENHLRTIRNYITGAHRRGMMTMAYNLLYGSWEDGPADGVSESWRLYRDQGHTQPAKIDFDQNWSSDIYLMNPADPGWQKYILGEMKKVFGTLDFDGWHIDQLGDWRPMWTSRGNPVKTDETFGVFLNAAHTTLNRPLVMNAVGQYGQRQIASSPVEFLYSEVWDPDSTYADLVRIIENNYRLGSGRLQTILAAYVNQGLAEHPGEADPASVLLADAVIFAAGGAHLELGEHLLAHPYFPNANLKMKNGLHDRLLKYYDFLVAYQNLLRGEVQTDSALTLHSRSVQLSDTPVQGKVWYYARKIPSRQIVHLVNFMGTATSNWRDNAGQQTLPQPQKNTVIYFTAGRPVREVWLASPDLANGLPQPLQFELRNGQTEIKIPELHIWDMIVIDYQD
ncbi:MAG: glycoside hydrolase family 66 protein [Calditrichia bacterium]